MAKCPNRNTNEYKVLRQKFKTNIATDNIINAWQELNNSDQFPTLAQANEFVKNQKTFSNLQKREFADTLLANLSRLNLIHKYNDNYYVTVSSKVITDFDNREYNEKVARNNQKAIQRYLYINNIPAEAININEIEVDKLNRPLFTVTTDLKYMPSDVLKASENRTSPHSAKLLVHLKRLFPELNVEVLEVNQARKYYEQLPEEQKRQMPFNKIKSFYVNDTAVLIKGRTSDETAIEEILHPFIDALYLNNRPLFDNLLKEAKENFPALWQSIQNSYTNNRGFTETERNLELVTQSLSRYFNNEFENNPTQSLKDRVVEFLKWFAGIVNNFYKFLTGLKLSTIERDIDYYQGDQALMEQEEGVEERVEEETTVEETEAPVYRLNVRDFNSSMTLSDVARMLNTSDIEFKLGRTVNNKVRYSLTPEKQRVVEYALSQAQNPHQANVIKRMFNTAMLDKAEFDNLVVGVSEPTPTDSLVAFDKDSHTYIDIMTGEPYLSATTAIKGGMTLEKQKEVQLNLEIGNEFDMILDAIVSDQSFESIKDNLKLLDSTNAEIAYNNMLSIVRLITADGGVAIPQVILYDKSTQIAGTADLLVITKEGKIKVLDLKTSKNFVKNNEGYDGKQWTLEGPKTEIVNGEEVIVPGSLLKQKGIEKLSTKQQHNLQVNLYRRMLENMGYEVDQSEWATSTFHIKVDIEGKGVDQKFMGTFQTDDWVPHPSSENIDMVNMLIPLFVDAVAEQQIDESKQLSDDTPIDQKTLLDDNEAKMDFLDSIGQTEYAVISGALEAYKGALIKQDKAIDMIKSNIFMDRSKEQTKEYIMNSIAAINVSMGEGPKARSALYTTLLRDALKQVRSFTEYVEDPNNYGKSEYIGYVLNFNRFIETFRGLHEIQTSDDLNATQRSLVLNLQLELNKLVNTSTSEGLIDKAITNYAREVIKSTTSRDFTETELDDLLVFAQDITTAEYLTGDLATSRDTILAIMDKIYKAKKQELLDKLELRNEIIRQKAAKLQRLSPEKDPQKLYHFMIEFDEDGVPTGQYVKKLGKNYYGKLDELRSKLIDDNGQWLEYRDVTDLDNASQEDINFNKKLAEAKKEYSDFWRAETKGIGGKVTGGNYHYYSQEFIDERAKFEYYSPIGEHGIWIKKSSVSSQAYAKFKAKYYEEVEYTKAVRVNGVATGQIFKDQVISVPKRKYRIARERTKSGISLLSEKYAAIMANTDTELGRAQKDFYETFVRIYENELLEKLPMGQRNQMLGKLPLQRARLYQNLKEKPNIVTRLWTKMTRSVKNLITETTQQKVILTDESGNLVDSLPIFYTGNLRNELELENIIKEIDELDKLRKDGKINKIDYTEKKKLLEGKRFNVENKPSVGELNLDLGNALMKFNAMAEHYETMGQVEDTLKALIKVLEKREYQPTKDTELYDYVKGKLVKRGVKGSESNVVARAKKWMNMVYYDNEKITKGFLEKVSDGLITYSSLAYVAFNPFGNFNNYALGRINNNIEMLGGRFFARKSYMKAEYEYNTVGLPGLIRRTASAGSLANLGDIATFNQFGFSNQTAYDAEKPMNKYEAFVDFFRMMDDKSDIRESGKKGDEVIESWYKKASAFGYILQDAAEYNVQTKVGMAMVMDVTMLNPDTGGTLSLYDAMQFDGETQTLKLKDGYTKVRKKNGQEVDFNDAFRYDLRNKIREVNKQIHGNYASEDRMVIQSYAVGRLAAQFHKWVAPAIKARFRREYFDENLGWMEGRYLSAIQFFKYSFGEIMKGELNFTKYGENFLRDEGFKGDGSQADQKAENKLLNTYRTLGEIAIIMSTLAISNILQMLFTGDDDDSEFEKRMENFMMYQANRTYKELILMLPIVPDSWTQMYQMAKSPIAATRTLGELGEAMSLTLWTPLAMLYYSDKEFKENSTYVYQRKPRKGQLKVTKAWKDAVPVIYSIQKWENYSQMKDFFIK
jgi:hypothetical protein